MPLNSHTHDDTPEKTGRLYILATPIGNMDDITIRALKTLQSVDLILAEDTRRTARLLSHHKIKARLVSCHEYNEASRIPLLLQQIENSLSVALVSDAGTPSVSDPGYRIVNAAIEKGISAIPIPGPSAITTALCVSGLPADTFIFAGFPPKKAGKRKNLLRRLSKAPETLIFYESPKRITGLITEIITIMGDRRGVLAREMTKIYEEFLRGRLSEILQITENRSAVKGECTLLVSGRHDVELKFSIKDAHAEIEKAIEKGDKNLSEIAKQIAKQFDLPRQEIYKTAQEIKQKTKKLTNKE